MNQRIDEDAFSAFEAAGWEERAGTYGAFVERVTARVGGPVLDAAGVGPGTRVLDVGTGPGWLAGRAAGRGARAVGVDRAEGMLEIARSRHPDIEFVRGDAEALPFADGSFDAAVACFLLLHLARPERAAAELARVLVPGGRVAATVWDEPSTSRLLGVIIDAVAAAGAQPPTDLPPGPPMFRFADDAEFERLLSDTGLDEVAVETVRFEEPILGPDELWDGLMQGSVRTRPLILGQPDEVQRDIRAHFDQMTEELRTGDRYAVPVSVKLASGRRP
jgi:SAM-dependent methyltransferase